MVEKSLLREGEQKSSRLQLVQFLELAIFGISIHSNYKSFAVLAEKSTQSPPLRPLPSIRGPNWSAGESASPALETLMLSLLGMHPGGEALK